ncbi:MAG TPA: hypothetical protein VGE57_04295 [Solimonas sp.]
MRKTAAVLVVVALVLIAAVLWWLRLPVEHDSFDYAAAFEQTPAASAGAGVDVLALAGRSPEEIERLLGPVAECEQALHSRRCRYAQSPVEIVFIAERADWFTIPVYGQDLMLDERSLARFGLPSAPATEVDAMQSVWRDLAGLKEVRLVGDENGVRFARIKAMTP